MDIDEFLSGGATIKNPNYKKPTKKNPGTPKFVQSSDYRDSLDRASTIGNFLSSNSYDLSGLQNEDNNYEDYNVRINPIDSQEDLNTQRAKNQSAFQQTYRFLGQAVGNEIVLGTALGLSNLVDFAANLGKESGQDDYTNPVSSYLEEKQAEVKKALDIYRENPNETWQVGDFGWWADNGVSIASTLSMLLPTMAVTKGLSYAGKLARLERVSMGIAKAAKLGGLTENAATLARTINATAEIGTSALLSRTMEGYMEARGVYKDTYDKSLGRLQTMTAKEKDSLFKNNPNFVGKTDDEIASYMSSLSADETFRNDYAMLLFDMAQFKALGSMWSGIAEKGTNASLRIANRAAIAGLADEGAAAAGKTGFLAKRLEAIQHAVKNPLSSLGAIELSEGIEEGYQGIQTEKGKEVAEKMFDPNYDTRSLSSYLTDGAIWEQAFWGVIGGVGFQVAGTALGNAATAVKGKINKANMSEQEYALSQLTDEKIREQEINSRKARLNDYRDAMMTLNDGKNPFGFRLDPDTKQPILDNGSKVNEDLSQDEVDMMKTRLTNDFVTNMVMDATDRGNYDLFKEYITNENFNKFFEDAGLTSTSGEKNFSKLLVNKMDQVHEDYNSSLYDILHSVDVSNENVAKIVARDIARRKLDITSLTDTSNSLATDIYNQADTSDYDNYEEAERVKYVERTLNQIADQEVGIQQLVDDKRISPQAAEQMSKENDIRRNQLLAFGSTNNMFGNTDLISQMLGNRIQDVNTSDFIKAFDDYLNSENNIANTEDSTKGTAAPKKSIQDLIKKKIVLDDHLSYLENTMPTTQGEYQSEYDNIAMNVDRLTVDRYNKAVQDVSEYIESQDNLEEARNNVLTNNVSEDLVKQLDILKLGHHSTQRYTAQINALINTIVTDRAKAAEEALNVNVDNNVSNDQAAQQEVADINEAVEATAEPEGEDVQSTNEPSSTGNIEQSDEVSIPELTGNINMDGQLGASDPSRTQANQTVETPTNNTGDTEMDRIRAITDPELRKTEEIKYIMGNLFSGVGEASANKIKEYADRILNGQSRESVIQGLPQSFVNGIDSLLNANGYNTNQTTNQSLDQTIEYIDQAVLETIDKENNEFILDNDARAIGFASSITLNLFKTSRNLFDNMEGKDVNSSEFNAIVDAVTEELLIQGVSKGYARQAAVDGVKLSLNMMQRRLAARGDARAELFKSLADQLANKQYIDYSDDNKAASTRAIPDTEFDAVVGQFIQSYITNRDVLTVKGTKTIIDINDLFNELLTNDSISFEQARQVFLNIADYIARPNNTSYIFTNKADFNKNLKTPSTFFSNLINSKSTVQVIDTYMHVAAPSNTPEGYNKAVNIAMSGGPVTITYFQGERGSSKNSISIKSDGVEIGYLGSVIPNATNTGYSLARQNVGFVYNLNKNNNNIESNLDRLFIPLIERSTDEMSQLMDIAYKQLAFETAIRNNQSESDLSIEDVEAVFKNSVIKDLIASGQLKIPEQRKTPRSRAQYVLNAINNIVFFDNTANSIGKIKDSYSYWKTNTFNNYTNTHAIQQALDKDNKITTTLVNVANGKVLLTADNNNISNLGFSAERNPIMIVDANRNIINESNNTAYNNVAGFQPGTMGMLIADNPNAPIIALFTEANKVSESKELANSVYTELNNLFTSFQNKEISFNVLGNRLSDLFAGPGVKSNNLFSGYSVIKTADQIALNIQGRKGEYAAIIHRLEKGANREGTGITHIPNGDRTKAVSFISPTKNLVNALSKEIVSNLTFNKTYYTVNNKNVSNDNSNHYISKKDGNFVVNIGGVSNTYYSFGHFAVINNAFKTNQGVNSDGTYFDNKERLKSLYINTAITSLPVEEGAIANLNQSPADIIRSASKTKGINTLELMTKAGVNSDRVSILTGNNEFGIEIIPRETFYDNKTTKAEAYYSGGKMFFTNKGASAINKSPNNLVRLLIHENLHGLFESQNLFQRDGLVDDLMDTYSQMVTAINNDIVNLDKTSDRYKDAKLIADWLTNNKFNAAEYFGTLSAEQQRVWAGRTDDARRRQFAEEWLVESLSQPAIVRYLNTTQYEGQEINVEGIDNANKTLWQKIIDVLLKLFGRNTSNIRNNTILAKQYSILGDNTTTTEAANVQAETQVDNNDKADKNGETDLDKIETGINLDQTNTTINDYLNDNNILDEQSDVDDLDFAVTSLIEDSNMPDKKGIDAIFEAVPELRDLGNTKQYSKYLDSIFPQSTVKDIVYHGSDNIFDVFEKGHTGPTGYKNNTEGIHLIDGGVMNLYAKTYGKMFPVIVDFKKSIVANYSTAENSIAQDLEYLTEANISSFEADGFDSGIIMLAPDEFEYVAFHPEQTYILGTPNDIAKFKEFVANNNNNQTADDITVNSYDNTPNVNPMGVQTISNMSDYLRQYSEQDKALIAKMVAANEIKFRCQ